MPSCAFSARNRGILFCFLFCFASKQQERKILRMFVQGDVLTEDWSDASVAWQP